MTIHPRAAAGAALALFLAVGAARGADNADNASASSAPRFSRHVEAVFSRLGCNGGACHGAVQGKNGFRLSLFAAFPDEDYEQLARGSRTRRLNLAAPSASLLLRKALGETPHGGGVALPAGGPEHAILLRWIAAGAPRDAAADSQVTRLVVSPAETTAPPGAAFALRVEAEFADGSREDVTGLCSFESRDPRVATVDRDGLVTTRGVGDTALVARFRSEPAVAMVVAPRQSSEPFPDAKPLGFIDEHLLAKLRRLNLPPSGPCDDAAFLRRASLDVAGRLPTPAEARAFLADADPNKRARLVDALLASKGHVDLWTLKFCDLLKASDFGVYADAVDTRVDALRFQAWVRARLAENTPWDEFAARVLTATSREGRGLAEWQTEVTALFAGHTAERPDLEVYARRRTLDLYWQRQNATGLPGALQAAHAFLGLRLECASCHRHPHDVWRQDDLLSFANFFARVRGAGFQGENEKRYPEVAQAYAALQAEAKKLEEQAKGLSGEASQAKQQAAKFKQDAQRLAGEIAALRGQADQARTQGRGDEAARASQQADAKQQPLEAARAEQERHERRAFEIDELGRRGKYLVEVGRRMMHAEIAHLGPAAANTFATVTSPLGTQSSPAFRLLGQSEPLAVAPEEDPRARVAQWLRDPKNPYFARAFVNRVWAHYFGRGLVDPPDHLSPLNPPSHPALLDELCRKFIENGYQPRWLHREILRSAAYQRSSAPTAANQVDQANYAYFATRRLDAEIALDAIDDALGSRENFGMQFWKWPEGLRAIEIPYPPEQNEFVGFMLEQFGRPRRNSAIQCDCERSTDSSILQALALANHPRLAEKIADPAGRAAAIARDLAAPRERVEEVFLATLSRLPTEGELAACLEYLAGAPNPEQGLRGLLWSLLNTKEFLLQH